MGPPPTHQVASQLSGYLLSEPLWHSFYAEIVQLDTLLAVEIQSHLFPF